MSSYEDMAELLAHEVLTDLAESFFGSRKHIDDMTELLNTYTDRLRVFDKEVSARAGLINFLFITPDNVKEFYSMLKIAPDLFVDCQFSAHVLPREIPFSFTMKGSFYQWVVFAYSSLQKSCHEYLFGKGFEDTGAKSIYKKDIYLMLVKNICQLINDRIDHVNRDMPPFNLLQYVRQFDPEYESKAHMSVAGFHGESAGINEKLAYKPIDFKSFKLKEYPELPKAEAVAPQLTQFSKQFYSRNRDDLQRRLYWLKDTVRKR